MKFATAPLIATLTLGVVAFAGVFAANPSLVAAAPTTSATPAYVLHDLQCDRHDNGVLDLTLVNDDPTTAASFTVATTATPVQYRVAPLSARAITMANLPDGPVVVPVMIDDVSSEVSVVVACDQAQVDVATPALPPTPTTAIVASGPAHHVVAPATPATSSAAAPPTTVSSADGGFMLPSTGSSVRGFVIGGVLVVAGIAASLLARRRYS